VRLRRRRLNRGDTVLIVRTGSRAEELEAGPRTFGDTAELAAYIADRDRLIEVARQVKKQCAKQVAVMASQKCRQPRTSAWPGARTAGGAGKAVTRGLTERVETPASRVGATATDRGASMGRRKTIHHVAPSEGGWSVRAAGASRASRIVGSQDDAIKIAITIARKSGGGDVYIHGADGRIRERATYGTDATATS